MAFSGLASKSGEERHVDVEMWENHNSKRASAQMKSTPSGGTRWRLKSGTTLAGFPICTKEVVLPDPTSFSGTSMILHFGPGCNPRTWHSSLKRLWIVSNELSQRATAPSQVNLQSRGA